jgi:phosphatidylglycerol:prolipoprotein diacylglycerol transferase
MLPYIDILGFRLHLYGLLVSAGYLVGLAWVMRNRRHIRLEDRPFWALVYTLFFGSLFGARIGFYVVEWDFIRRNPSFIWRYWQSGYVLLAGVIGSIVAGWLYQLVYNRTHRPIAYLPVADYCLTAGALGHGLGRVGCFLQGCCHGRPTGMPWGVALTHPASSVLPGLAGIPLHPVQLYEAAGELCIFLFLAAWVLPRVRAGRLRYGMAFLGQLFLYSVLRFFLECFRGDSRGTLLSPALSPSQWLALGTALTAAGVCLRRGIVERRPGDHTLYLG